MARFDWSKEKRLSGINKMIARGNCLDLLSKSVNWFFKESLENFYVDIGAYRQARSSIPHKIPLLNLLFESCYRFQIHLCIPACVMSSEFANEVVMKFLSAQFSWFWCNCLESNFVHNIKDISNWPSTEKVWQKIHHSLHMQECWFEFDTGWGNN